MRTRRSLSLFLSLTLFLQQSGFAQSAAQLDLAGAFADAQRAFQEPLVRPAHLRSLSYDAAQAQFGLFIDRTNTEALEPRAAEELLRHFFVGVSLPNSSFWVNLRPDSPDRIIDPYLEKTDVGKILLEADVALKRDTARATAPSTPAGKEYWAKLYAKAGALFGSQSLSIPTLCRPWIVPDEIVIRSSDTNAYIYKATLKVMLEEDYIQDASVMRQYAFGDERLRELNAYAAQLMRELILPELTRKVNTEHSYAPLRQVYYALILAQWFKQRFHGSGDRYSSLIDRKELSGLRAQQAWSKEVYFKQYQESFKKGEYSYRAPAETSRGPVIRTYFSGGVGLDIGAGLSQALTAASREPGVPHQERVADTGTVITGVSGSGSIPEAAQASEILFAQTQPAVTGPFEVTVSLPPKPALPAPAKLPPSVADRLEEAGLADSWFVLSQELPETQVDPFFRIVAELEGGTAVFGGSDLVALMLGVSKSHIDQGLAEVNVVRPPQQTRGLAAWNVYPADNAPGFEIPPWGSRRQRVVFRAASPGKLDNDELMVNAEAAIALEDYIRNFRQGRYLIEGHPQLNVPLKYSALVEVSADGKARIYFRTPQDRYNYEHRILTLPDPQRCPADWGEPFLWQDSLTYAGIIYARGFRNGWHFEENGSSLALLRRFAAQLSGEARTDVRDTVRNRIVDDLLAGTVSPEELETVFQTLGLPEEAPGDPAAAEEGMMKPLGVRSALDEDREERLQQRHAEFLESAEGVAVQRFYQKTGITAKVIFEDLGAEAAAYHFSAPDGTVIIVANTRESDALQREGMFHEAWEAHWQAQGFSAHEAHVIASAQQAQTIAFRHAASGLSTYHFEQLQKADEELLRQIVIENEEVRDRWHHRVLARANAYGADININAILRYEARLRFAAKQRIGQAAFVRNGLWANAGEAERRTLRHVHQEFTLEDWEGLLRSARLEGAAFAVRRDAAGTFRVSRNSSFNDPTTRRHTVELIRQALEHLIERIPGLGDFLSDPAVAAQFLDFHFLSDLKLVMAHARYEHRDLRLGAQELISHLADSTLNYLTKYLQAAMRKEIAGSARKQALPAAAAANKRIAIVSRWVPDRLVPADTASPQDVAAARDPDANVMVVDPVVYARRDEQGLTAQGRQDPLHLGTMPVEKYLMATWKGERFLFYASRSHTDGIIPEDLEAGDKEIRLWRSASEGFATQRRWIVKQSVENLDDCLPPLCIRLDLFLARHEADLQQGTLEELFQKVRQERMDPFWEYAVADALSAIEKAQDRQALDQALRDYCDHGLAGLDDPQQWVDERIRAAAEESLARLRNAAAGVQRVPVQGGVPAGGYTGSQESDDFDFFMQQGLIMESGGGWRVWVNWYPGFPPTGARQFQRHSDKAAALQAARRAFSSRSLVAADAAITDFAGLYAYLRGIGRPIKGSRYEYPLEEMIARIRTAQDNPQDLSALAGISNAEIDPQLRGLRDKVRRLLEILHPQVPLGSVRLGQAEALSLGLTDRPRGILQMQGHQFRYEYADGSFRFQRVSGLRQGGLRVIAEGESTEYVILGVIGVRISMPQAGQVRIENIMPFDLDIFPDVAATGANSVLLAPGGKLPVRMAEGSAGTLLVQGQSIGLTLQGGVLRLQRRQDDYVGQPRQVREGENTEYVIPEGLALRVSMPRTGEIVIENISGQPLEVIDMLQADTRAFQAHGRIHGLFVRTGPAAAPQRTIYLNRRGLARHRADFRLLLGKNAGVEEIIRFLDGHETLHAIVDYLRLEKGAGLVLSEADEERLADTFGRAFALENGRFDPALRDELSRIDELLRFEERFGVSLAETLRTKPRQLEEYLGRLGIAVSVEEATPLQMQELKETAASRGMVVKASWVERARSWWQRQRQQRGEWPRPVRTRPFADELDARVSEPVRQLLRAVREVEAEFGRGAVVLYGGPVRDLLMGRSAQTRDIDLLVGIDEATMSDDAAIVRTRAVLNRLEEKLGLGWNSILRRATNYDFIGTFDPSTGRVRAKPGLEQFIGTIQESFNTMILFSDGTLFDSFGGQADLEKSVIRFVGADPQLYANHQSVLRAVRFHQQHGFRYEPQTQKIVESFFLPGSGFVQRQGWEEWFALARWERSYRLAKERGDLTEALRLADDYIRTHPGGFPGPGKYGTFEALEERYLREMDFHRAGNNFSAALDAFERFMVRWEFSSGYVRWAKNTAVKVTLGEGKVSDVQNDPAGLGAQVRDIFTFALDPQAAAAELMRIGFGPFLETGGIDLRDVLRQRAELDAARQAQGPAPLYGRPGNERMITRGLAQLHQFYPGLAGALDRLNRRSGGGRVLVIGPGMGFEVLDIIQHYTNLRVESSGAENFFTRPDLSARIAARYPGIHVPAALRTLQDGFHEGAVEKALPQLLQGEGRFDAIILGSNVGEYIQDKAFLITAVHQLLAPGGTAFLELPNMVIDTDAQSALYKAGLLTSDIAAYQRAVRDSRGFFGAFPEMQASVSPAAALILSIVKKSQAPLGVRMRFAGTRGPVSAYVWEDPQGPAGPAPPEGTPAPGVAPGGIDFRALPIVQQPLFSLPQAALVPAAGVSAIERAGEWERIERMIKSGILPSSGRLQGYLSLCAATPAQARELRNVLLCIARILRIQEERPGVADPGLIALLASLEAGITKPRADSHMPTQ